MDVVFLSKLSKIVLGFARVELQMIKIKFFQFPAIYVIFHCSNRGCHPWMSSSYQNFQKLYWALLEYN